MMTRIFKEYNFNYNHQSVDEKTLYFSSYPATISSIDDYYITSNNFAVIETTNVMFDEKLFKWIKPQSLLTYQRAMIANRMSSNAEQWVDHFKEYNSGRYNNMFMVLDMKLVDLENRIISPKAMFITEQIPDYISKQEVTD